MIGIVFKLTVMSYGSQIWGSAGMCHLRKLHTLTNSFLRQIVNAPRKHRYESTFDSENSIIDKFQRLDTCQSQISEQFLDTEDAVQEYLDDMEDAENYRDRYIEMCTRVDLKIRETVVPTETEKRSFKLPKIELKKFSGEAKDFFAFWSQFQKIHNDKGIAEEDKMQYLLQSVEPKSKAERLVLSFPATAENYPKAIDQLKERFGREDLLVQIYDELEGKLRSLESLGRTQEKYGDFLTPLVESCLPEEILMAWERKRNSETDAKGSQTLEHLMTFLRLEVQGEEMVQLAKSSFGTPIRKKDSPIERVKPTELMTASALASSVKSSVLSEKKICGFISKIEDKRILNELKNKEIILSDLNCKETEIGLLIGADNIGKLLTGNLIEFDSGLTAIETKLGWTVIGKVCSNDKNVMLTTSSLHVRNVSVKELWELDVLGITDPLLNENTKENFELTDFKNKMKILPDGRYEVKLPWKCNSENLPSNKELTWKRHLRMMNKLRNGKFFEDYKSVFRQWEYLNIFERVPEVELNNECHYLPHRPVIKLDSATTKIRPVFDASAREKGKPSLNDCLYKGVNLIELIPDILDRFRIYPVGIVADIEKAFLMLSVAPKDRDYLRFFSHAMKNN
ncbi:integrase catalytic domain-containing protein [Trichonephila clavipes]|nr:integrase catalytic domain-containing protein [Trichonephila clavipes]